MPTLSRTITTSTPIERVWPFMSDLSTTQRWDPATVRCHRVSGDGGVGTVYENVSRFRNRETTLRYVVEQVVEPERYVVRGQNRTVTSIDDMRFASTPDGGTQLVYTIWFVFAGMAKLAVPLLSNALSTLVDDGARGIRSALDAL